MEWYYKKKNADYKSMPPIRADCRDQSEAPLAFVYPQTGSRLSRARSLEGELQGIVCKVAHRNPDAELFWYLNDKFLGTTQRYHEYNLNAPEGRHVITVVDENGEDARSVIWVD
jgi:penicillin-binding protein 1C